MLYCKVVVIYDENYLQVVQLYKKFELYVDPSKNSASKEDDNPGRWSRKQAELFFAREASKLLYENPALLQIQISQLLHSNPDYAEAVSKCSTKK